jgi:hypothetical protein
MIVHPGTQNTTTDFTVELTKAEAAELRALMRHVSACCGDFANGFSILLELVTRLGEDA